MINEFLGLLMTSLKVSFCIIEFSFFTMFLKRVCKTSFSLVMWVKKKYLDEMNNILNHRGPDGKGKWISSAKNIGFGHTRLSILDLTSSANQPFVDKTKNYVITFNGEIEFPSLNSIKCFLPSL